MANPNDVPITRNELKEALVEFARELKQPSELEARKQERELLKDLEEQEREEQRRQQMVQMAKNEEAVRIATQRSCTHMREDQTPAIVGQVHSDNMIQPMCLRCSALFEKIKANQEHIVNGVRFMRVPPLPKHLQPVA